jgi:hypothetical protein
MRGGFFYFMTLEALLFTEQQINLIYQQLKPGLYPDQKKVFHETMNKITSAIKELKSTNEQNSTNRAGRQTSTLPGR